MVRFDKPCFAVRGAVEYFREHMALGDYLTQEGQAEMTWVGRGAEKLGLQGQCDLPHFERLCSGLHPVNPQKLLVRDKGTRRRVCYFGQVSPPKDVSILYLVAGDKRIGDWWREAVAETVREMEAVIAARVRRAGENRDRPTGNMVATIVTHDTNRALDPQLHTHLCIMNLTFDTAEDRWKSVQPMGLYRHQGYFREVCYNRLAARMLAAGYELEPARKIGFTVKGVPPELCATFSKRRQQILREAAKAGATSQDDLQDVTLRTRAAKTNATAATLRAAWQQECGPHLDALHATIARAQTAPPYCEPITALDAVRSGEAHVFERRSVVNDRVLRREALIAGRGQVTLDALSEAVSTRIESGELIRSDDELASHDGLRSEQEFTGWANTQLRACTPFGKLTATMGAGLEKDQNEAVAGILASRSRVVVFQGDAGTGKTSCLTHVVKGIERTDGHVFGCAPSASAADTLRKELTTEADTLQQLLVNESLQQRIKGRTVLVDEAGLVSVRELRDLCRLAARNDNRLILVGDIKQHSSVEAGDALRCLQEFARVPVFHLAEIRRQKNPAYRKAVAMLARHDAIGAFNAFDRLGAVQEVPSTKELWRAAASDYVRTVRAGNSCLAICPVWSEIHRFTSAVRDQLQVAGLLSLDERSVTTVHSLKWTQEERRRVQNYQPGDILTFHHAYGIFRKFDSVAVVRRDDHHLVVRDGDGRERRLEPRRARGFDVGVAGEISVATGDRLLVRANLKSAGLRNGDFVEVAGVRSDCSIALKDGRELPAWFREFSHGYAATSHASQGKTVSRGILLLGDEGIAAANLKQAYVSNSRFEESQVIYTSDKAAAREAMMRPADRKLALELVGPDMPEEASGVPRPRIRIAPSKEVAKPAA